MRILGLILPVLIALAAELPAADNFRPVPQTFLQEIARRYAAADGLTNRDLRLIELAPDGAPRVWSDGQWWELRRERWRLLPDMESADPGVFVFPDAAGKPVRVAVAAKGVRQLLRFGATNWLATTSGVFEVAAGAPARLISPAVDIRQLTLSPTGRLHAAAASGLLERGADGDWRRLEILDDGGRAWAARDVRGVGFDSLGRLWFASRAGVGCRDTNGWRFFEGKDGLPYNDFTGLAAGPAGEVWLATRIGVIRFDGREWHYRQGPRWLPNDDVRQLVVDAAGRAWCATADGVGVLERKPMTLHDKAAFYENEIARYVQRTPFGYVSEARLRRTADRSSADPDDSDNDGLWTAMYGAGECLAYAATKDPRAKARAQRVFEALRFLQKVTQGGPHAPPPGFIARSIRSTDLPDPNLGGVERDRADRANNDKLWKILDPRWPRSADGQWFWKADTSSDELDGHYFFLPLYYDFCADNEAERVRVREVVRDLTDHLLAHDFALVDHDGAPTRWGVYGPATLNRDPRWWAERGLNSLSLLTYLTVAEHITGDAKYGRVARELIEQHGYAQNALVAKIQMGVGSGNQSDDEMAVMCYYNLLRLTRDAALRASMQLSFYHYWMHEQPEMNPFFHFAYAAQGLGQRHTNQWNSFSLAPWDGWLEDSAATLRGFPLDRLNWPHRNSHRLDVVPLSAQQARDIGESRHRTRGQRVNGRVLPVENRHFGHWNTDPWQLDYGGDGRELAAGTVFLLPYYLGLYHGFIEKPAP